jgi:hypothetical protein
MDLRDAVACLRAKLVALDAEISRIESGIEAALEAESVYLFLAPMLGERNICRPGDDKAPLPSR